MMDPSLYLLTILGLQQSANLSPFLIKLLETLEKGFGTAFKPAMTLLNAKADSYAIKEKANADGFAIEATAKSKATASLIKAEAEEKRLNIHERTRLRIDNREIRRQENLENIVREAAKIEPENVSSESVDDDWITQFFDNAQDISNEKMQLLWAQILAGEIAKPGEFSFRTLQTLKVMSQRDAELFRIFCNYAWKLGKERILFVDEEILEYLNGGPLRYSDFVHLEAIGLISMTNPEIVIFPTEILVSQFEAFMEYGGFFYNLGEQKYAVTYPQGRVATLVGQELAALCDVTPDDNYRQLVVRTLYSKGWRFEIIEKETMKHSQEYSN